MRRNWLLLGIALLVALLTIGAVACSDDDDDDNGNGVEPEATVVIGEPEATDEVTDGDGDGDGGEVLLLVATILEVDGSGVSGEVQISPDVDGILVDVVVAGLAEGAHQNHLHHSEACPPDPGGDIHIALTDVEADANGDGIQTTSDDTAAIDHYATGHYYAVHADDGAVIGCGTVVSGIS